MRGVLAEPAPLLLAILRKVGMPPAQTQRVAWSLLELGYNVPIGCLRSSGVMAASLLQTTVH